MVFPFAAECSNFNTINPTKFDQNPTHSNRDISRKSGTDRHAHTHTDRQIKLGGATVYQTVTIKFVNFPSDSDDPPLKYQKSMEQDFKTVSSLNP